MNKYYFLWEKNNRFNLNVQSLFNLTQIPIKKVPHETSDN